MTMSFPDPSPWPLDDSRSDRTTASGLRRWRWFLRSVAAPATEPCERSLGDGSGARLGKVLVFRTHTRDSRYLRDGALAARSRYRDHILVLLVLRGSLRADSGNRAMELRRGDIGFLDLAQCATLHAADGAQLGLLVPRSLLKGEVHGLALRESQLVCRMLTRQLEQLVLSLPSIESAQVDMLVETTMAVVQLCVDFCPQPRPDTGAEPLRSRILDHIEANLDDVELVPESIARDFGLSRTRLYELFLGSGGIKRCIRDKRLDAAFRDLCECPAPKVIDVAYRRGFTSERQFQRAFQARFGTTPSTVRDRRKHGDPANDD